MANGGRIVTLVGQSGSGKTTQMRELVGEQGFRLSPNITTRPPRESDLAGEYTYIPDDEYAGLLKSGRLLWNVVTGNGAHYSKDVCDVIEALTDPDNIYVHALVPGKANDLVRRYGSEVVKTIFLPSPGDDVLLKRMITRGDSARGAAERLTNEEQEGWLVQSLAITGLHVVTAQGVAERHQEILDFTRS